MTYGQVPGGRRAIDVLAEHWSSESGGNCYSKIVRTSAPLCAVLGEAFPGLGARHRANTDGIPLYTWECTDGTFMGQTDCSAYAATIEDMIAWTGSPYGGTIHAVCKGRHDNVACSWYLETNAGRRQSISVVHQELVRVMAVVMMWNCNGKTVEAITDPRASCTFTRPC